MRALLAAVGTRGDVQPALGLATELRKLGHAVRLCVSPNFVGWAQSLGFDAVPMGVEMRMPSRKSRARPTLTPEEMHRLRDDLIADQFETIGSAAAGCDVIVGCNEHQYAGPSIAERTGIGCVTAVYAPVALPSPSLAPPPLPGTIVDASGSTSIEEQWRNTAQAWNDRALERINSNRQGGDPPIFVGFGSVPAAGDVTRRLIGAARAVHRRIVVSKGWAELELTDDERDCIAVDDVSHDVLFPRVAAVVHHGGAGTTATAARAGVPQVITPMFGDQFYWASRIVVLGIGATTSHATMTEESLTHALRDALAPAVAHRARALVDQVGGDGAAVAALRLQGEYGRRG